MPGSRFSVEVQPVIPSRLKSLEELASNLFYAWNIRVRQVFIQLDPELWESCGHNPKVFLHRIAQHKLDQAAEDRLYIESFQRALSIFDNYHQKTIDPEIKQYLDPDKDLVAYFCAEFGLHESLPIYSGGLGILAGDHCKAASDLNLPFVAVGLLYRQGYFTQSIDAHGNQVAHFTPSDFHELAIRPATTEDGSELITEIPVADRTVYIKVWYAQAGHITLYLLDTDIDKNSDEDRSITYQLYGGDNNTRIQQEIVLSLGGLRTLRRLGHTPTVWHINEGHAAFLILERCREYVNLGMDFNAALELTAASTVFTTHTPVPAGHDIFEHEMVVHYLRDLIDELNISNKELLALGESAESPGRFNMTTLALRGSRFHNGVSRIHGGVASRMEADIWPQIPAEENPIDYVTNGVHIYTFLAHEWINVFDMRFGNSWRNELLNVNYWERIDEIPNHNFWSVRQSLKAELIVEVCQRVKAQYLRHQYSEAQIDRVINNLTKDLPNTLVLGFARRFATYKRATLFFSDPERLARLLNDKDKPVVVLFAGKAHPSDMPGQHLIKVIHDFSKSPEFRGKIILLENYDLQLGRLLVAGVDVWLNTPEYPLEASGTSGEKAGMNGALNLSILDGWWGEGYNHDNGWGITPHGPQYDNTYRDRQEANELLDILEHEVIPTYFQRNENGFSERWIRMSKASMKYIIPRFNAQRMVMDYVKKFYGPAADQYARFNADNYANAYRLAEWKKKIASLWPGVSIKHIHELPTTIKSSETVPIQVSVNLNGLDDSDVVVECLFGTETVNGEFKAETCHRLLTKGKNEFDETIFGLDITPPLPGLQYYKIRMYPYNRLLTHPFETGHMIWA